MSEYVISQDLDDSLHGYIGAIVIRLDVKRHIAQGDEVPQEERDRSQRRFEECRDEFLGKLAALEARAASPPVQEEE